MSAIAPRLPSGEDDDRPACLDDAGGRDERGGRVAAVGQDRSIAPSARQCCKNLLSKGRSFYRGCGKTERSAKAKREIARLHKLNDIEIFC
jgi:hypothetical protein